MQQTFERLQRRRFLRGDFTHNESQTESHHQRSAAGNRNLAPPNSNQQPLSMRWFERMQRETPIARLRRRAYLNHDRGYWSRRAGRIPPPEEYSREMNEVGRRLESALDRMSRIRREMLNFPVVQINSVPVNNFNDQSSPADGNNSNRRSFASEIMHPFPIPAHYSHNSTSNSERNRGDSSTLNDEPIPSTSQNNNPRAQVLFQYRV